MRPWFKFRTSTADLRVTTSRTERERERETNRRGQTADTETTRLCRGDALRHRTKAEEDAFESKNNN